MYSILLVDDEVWMIEGVKKLLKCLDIGFQVAASARNGKQALQEMEGRNFDVVLCDIRMPVMDGLELLKEMRLRQMEIPVVLITGHSEFEYARTAFRLGAADYLLKPLNLEEMKAVLEHLKPHLEARTAGLIKQANDSGQPAEDSYRQGALFVEHMLGAIRERFHEDLSVAGFAEQAGFNPSYLSRLFKLETGKGFVQMLTEQRMEEAKKLLGESRQNIAAIARQVGYWDDKHFIRTFKKETGYTPAEYRIVTERER